MQYDAIAPYPPVSIPKAKRKRRPVSPIEHWNERIAEAKELAAAGATDAEMATFFEIDVKTLYAWRAASPGFNAACRLGKEMPDARVHGVAFTLTQGFSYTTQEAVKVRTGEHTEAVEVVDVVKFMPPDKTMIAMWMKNRLGWRDQVDAKVSAQVEHSGTVTVDADPKRLAIALLATLRKAVEAPVIDGEIVDDTDV